MNPYLLDDLTLHLADAKDKTNVQAPSSSAGTNGTTDQKRIAVLGASGYTGEEVVRLLAQHPVFQVTTLTGESQAGKVNFVQSIAAFH